MLYKHNDKERINLDLFKNPTSEYRGTPFWSWNTRLNKEMFDKHIKAFKEMGLGGFQMHSRDGLKDEYLGKDFMENVRYCVDRAKEEGMYAWLYDEDRWPSGTAGGIVTKKNKRFCQRYLHFTVNDPTRWCIEDKEQALDEAKCYYLTTYDIVLDENNFLKSYKQIGKEDKAEGTKWYVYCRPIDEWGWYNNSRSVNRIDKDAIDSFIDITYERYKEYVGDEFKKTCPAIFFDEPADAGVPYLENSTDTKDFQIGFLYTFPEVFKEKFGMDFFEILPELVWELPNNEASYARYCYYELKAELFQNNFVKNICDWCTENGIYSTGHFLFEENTEIQVKDYGDLLRQYRYMDIPGSDMLAGGFNIMTSIMPRSIAHQYNKEGVLCELYGATNWDYDFRGHKFQGDALACSGVTARIHHLTYLSMESDAKRDFPASIGYQNPYYTEYSFIEDHFARLNTALTRGKPVVNVAMLYPIESMWVKSGPYDKTRDDKYAIGMAFNDITEWLTEAHYDFDYFTEALVPELYSDDKPMNLGFMKYDALLIPNVITLRSTTLEMLEKYKKAGGRVIFIGDAPTMVDGKISDEAAKVYNESIVVPCRRNKIIDSLKGVETVTITGDNKRMYQLREEDDCKWLFICKYVREKVQYIYNSEDVTITIDGTYKPTVFNTLNGETEEISFKHEKGKTIIRKKLYYSDSLLLQLKECEVMEEQIVKELPTDFETLIDFKKRVNVTLDEPNVCLLDIAEYRLDDEEWSPAEESYKLDEKLRKRLGYINNGCQPWAMEDIPPEHTVSLRYTIESEDDFKDCYLAYEEMDKTEITLNGKKVDVNIDGYYIDMSFKKCYLGDIKKGTNTLVITMPFQRRYKVENGYLLGNFGVKIAGAEKILYRIDDKIGFSDIVGQGYPFYGGVVNYNCDLDLAEDRDIIINAGYYEGSLINVYVDDEFKGRIVYAPYDLRVEGLKAGKHKITFKFFGNRYNTLAAIHNINPWGWHSDPNTWKVTGMSFSYGYEFKPAGILKSPEIKILKK